MCRSGHNNVTGGCVPAAVLALTLVLTGCGALSQPETGRVVVTRTSAAHQSRKLHKPRPAVSPVQLVGLSEPQAEKLLGTPEARADSGDAEIWTYRQEHCSLTLTFFLDVTHNEYKALSRAVAGTDGSEKQAQNCIRQIMAHAKSS